MTGWIKNLDLLQSKLDAERKKPPLWQRMGEGYAEAVGRLPWMPAIGQAAETVRDFQPPQLPSKDVLLSRLRAPFTGEEPIGGTRTMGPDIKGWWEGLDIRGRKPAEDLPYEDMLSAAAWSTAMMVPPQAGAGYIKPQLSPSQIQKHISTARTLIGKGKPISFKDTALGTKLRAVIKLHQEARSETAAAQHIGRSAKAGALAQAQKTTSAAEALGASERALTGPFGRTIPEIPSSLRLGADDFDELFKVAKASNLDPWDTQNLLRALMKDAPDDVLQPNQIKLLNRVFFPGESGLTQKVWANVLDAANAPRAMLASVDHSAVFRQGIFETIYQGFRHPIRTAQTVLNGFKMLVAPGARAQRTYTYYDLLLRRDKSFALWETKGMYFAPNVDDVAVSLTRREEQYMSRLAQKIPWIKRSEAAYTYTLNRLRLDAAKSVGDDLAKLGGKDADYRLFAQIVNASTGRGDVGVINKVLTAGRGDIAPALNATFFSPRLLMSRFQMPYYTTKAIFRGTVNYKDPAARLVMKEAAGRLAAMASVVGTTLGILKETGVVEVETDPRSPDFLKGKIGNTRIDTWAGFQQIFRFLYQMASGEQKSSTTGIVRDVNKRDLIWKFLQSKAAPSVGIVLDLLAGETYIGEEVARPQWVREKLVPLFLQDMWDAFEDRGLIGMGIVAPAFFGVGAQTYGGRASSSQRKWPYGKQTPTTSTRKWPY